MTTTLVLTPEREAHIALLKERTVQIKVANDFDGTFDTDSILVEVTSSLWDALTPGEQTIFTGDGMPIEYVGIGQCAHWMGCSDIKHLYNMPTIVNGNITSETTTDMCINCHASALYRFCFDQAREKILDLVYESSFREALEVQKIFPPATEEETKCYRCDGLLAPENVTTNTWTRTVEVYVNEDHEQQLVHARCAYNCPGCNTKWTYSNYNWRIGSDNYCKPCFTKHEENNEIIDCEYGDHSTFDSELMYSSIRDDYMCQACYECSVECGDCGYEYYEDNGHTCEDDEDTPNYSEYIHSYSYRPRPSFYPDRYQPYYLGIELEVEVTGNDSRHDCAEQVIMALSDRVYLKEDGSLSNGFEIVTHPHSLLEYQNSIDWDFLKTLSRMGVRSWNRSSCGLHVHVSRTAFNGDTYATKEAHLVRFNKLIYDNQRQVERLAGRKNNQYASFDDKGKIVPKVKFGNQSSGRYSAVNMEPENTVEVRVFKGSLRKERVLSGIEFVAAAVEYTRNLKIQHKSAPFAWARFVHYVTTNSDTYPNLFTIMNETFEKDNDPNGDN